MKTAREVWDSRNPVHEINLNTGVDMFYQTMELCMEEYRKQGRYYTEDEIRVIQEQAYDEGLKFVLLNLN